MGIYQINKDYYSKKKVAQGYVHIHDLQKPEQRIFEKYQQEFKNKAWLDIGCGAGRTTPHLLNLSANYIGIDYSEDMIVQCQNRFRDAQFLHCDVRDMSCFEKEQFEVILFSYNGLDYLSHEDRIIGLREIYRVLKKGGFFIFSSHNRNCRHQMPLFDWTLNPLILTSYLCRFPLKLSNRFKNKKHEFITEDYAILNDRVRDYSLLTYYISKSNAVRQLENEKFTIKEVINLKGEFVDPHSPDYESSWLYYLSQKNFRPSA